MDRRGALKSLGVIGAGLAASQLTLPSVSGASVKGNWIDAHSHVWTRDLKKYPLANNQTVDVLDPPSFTGDELWNLVEPLGVNRVVLIAHHLYYAYDNSYMTDLAAAHPERFRVVGLVDEMKPDVAKTMRELLKQKVTGFRITPWINGDKWLESEGMGAAWKCAAETGQAMCCLIDAKNIPQVASMCEKNPDTNVVIDHFARIGVDGVVRDTDVKALCALAKFKRVKVKISAYYALGKKQPPYEDLLPMIKQLYMTFGPGRLMWASDAPYQLGGENSYAASLELITKRADFLSETDRESILRKSAEETYFFA